MPDDRHIFRPELPRRNVAVAAVFVSGLLFAVMGVMTKMCHTAAFVGRPIPASEVVLARFGFGLLVLLPLHGRRGIDLFGRDRRRLLLRGIWGGFAVYFYFLSIQQTSLAHAQLLNYASIIFAPLFAWIFLKERVGTRASLAILVAVLGIALITLQTGAQGTLNTGDLFGLISGILAGASITEIRRLRQSETAWSVFFYLCLVGLPVALVACIIQPPVLPTFAGWSVLGMMGAASMGAQILLTYGYKYLRAAEGTLISMTQLLYNSVAGGILFGEALTLWTLAGAALIVGSAIFLTAQRPQPVRT
jgi:drug/metabolite transporter (DMT)-like permease